MSAPTTITPAEVADLRGLFNDLLDDVSLPVKHIEDDEEIGALDFADGVRDFYHNSERAGAGELIAAAINALPALLAIAEAHQSDREATWLEYIRFLIEVNQGPIQLAWAHGWRCPDGDIAKGEELRARLGLGDDNRPLSTPAPPSTDEETACAPV